MRPELHSLASYKWSQDPVFYRTGVVCSKDGLIKFFFRDENGEDHVQTERFHINKEVFKTAHFRARLDLQEGRYVVWKALTR